MSYSHCGGIYFLRTVSKYRLICCIKSNVPIFQQKSKRKKTGTSSRKSETERDDQYTERVVSAQRASKWKPMSKNTKEFVLASLDSSIV